MSYNKKLLEFFDKLISSFYKVELYLLRKIIVLKRLEFPVYRKYHSSFFLFSTLILLLFFSCHIDTSPKNTISGIRGKIVNLARSLKGITYRYGGTDIYGFDCSGFVYYVYDSFGIKVPRTAKKQGRAGRRIKLKRSKSGDILVFKLNNSWHSGIIKRENNNLFLIHAPNSLSVVREEALTGYWIKRLRYVVRVL